MSELLHITREPLGEVAFSVSARVAVQLGRQSISGSVTAILELVKNAYDADAENVFVRFIDLGGTAPTLIIDDDGYGMTSEQVKNNWLVIGTDNKLRARRSRDKKRVLIGEKGLGRLGLDRLCTTTILQTFAEEESIGTELVIDWTKYEGTNVRLEEVKHTLFRLNSQRYYDVSTQQFQEKTHGTRLVLAELKDPWSETDIADLRKELSLLISPFGGVNAFQVWLYQGEDYEAIGSSEILNTAEWQLTATIDEDYQLKYQMTSREGIQFDFAAPWMKVFNTDKSAIPLCGPVEFLLYFFLRPKEKTSSIERSQINTFLESNQGIRIYRDNFRVKPYGDPSGAGDWLKLAYRRTQHPTSLGGKGWRVGYNQVVGAVFLEKERNEALLDQTNREGILEGQAFDQLRKFTEHAIEWFERRASEYARDRREEDAFREAGERARVAGQKAKAATNSLEETLDEIVGLVQNSQDAQDSPDVKMLRTKLSQSVRILKASVNETIRAKNDMTRAHREQQREIELEKNTLQNLASLGILAVAFGHETLGHSNLLVGNSQLLKQRLQLLLDELSTELTTMLGDMEYAAKRIRAFGKFMLRNVRRSKREQVLVYLDSVIRDVVEPFDLPATRNIRVEYDFPADRVPPVKAFIIDWESILINLITNAVWALTGITERERRIRIRLRQKENLVEVAFADSGTGIEVGTLDYIFDPTFTTKRNERGDRTGTGMGLAILDNIVHSYGGTIRVDAYSELGGAQFNILIPIAEPNERPNK